MKPSLPCPKRVAVYLAAAWLAPASILQAQPQAASATGKVQAPAAPAVASPREAATTTTLAAAATELPAGTVDVLRVLRETGGFETLLQLVEATGYTATLTGNDPVTFLAPNDAAFARMDPEDINRLLIAENREKAEALLRFHTIPGRRARADLFRASKLPTLEGQPLPVKNAGMSQFLAGAAIVRADLPASNGVVHILDSVAIPDALNGGELRLIGPSIPKRVGRESDLKILAGALESTGLTGTLVGEGPFTLLAPTDEAFRALGEEKLKELLAPENRRKLAVLLKNHIIAGRLNAGDVTAARSIATMGGSEMPIGILDGTTTIGPAKFIRMEIPAGNGAIFTIDSVLLPEQ